MTQYLNYLKINALCNDVVVTIHAASSSPSPPLLPFLDSCELEIVILMFLEKDRKWFSRIESTFTTSGINSKVKSAFDCSGENCDNKVIKILVSP